MRVLQDVPGAEENSDEIVVQDVPGTEENSDEIVVQDVPGAEENSDEIVVQDAPGTEEKEVRVGLAWFNKIMSLQLRWPTSLLPSSLTKKKNKIGDKANIRHLQKESIKLQAAFIAVAAGAA